MSRIAFFPRNSAIFEKTAHESVLYIGRVTSRDTEERGKRYGEVDTGTANFFGEVLSRI